MYCDEHTHMCICCEATWTCQDDECGGGDGHGMSVCKRCETHCAPQGFPESRRKPNVHIHTCLLCGKESECESDCGMPDGSVSETTCGICQTRLDAVLERTRAQRVNAPVMHAHSCPECGNDWDCSRDCQRHAESVSEMTPGIW